MSNTSRFKNTLIGMGKSSLWISTFIVVQMFTAMGFMLHKIFTDDVYADLFYCLVKPIYDVTDSSIERAIQMIAILDQLFADILMPAMITANTLIIVIFCIVINRKSIVAFITGRKNDFKEKRMEFCRKISNMTLSKSCFDFVFLALGLNGIISISSIIVQKLLPENIGIMHDESINLALSGPAMLCLLSTGILTPIAEEIIFRYGVKNALTRISPKFALIMQTVIFGLLHVNLIQCVYAIIIGYIFGIADNKYKSIFPSCIMHIVINSSSVILSLAASSVKSELVGYGIMAFLWIGYSLY